MKASSELISANKQALNSAFVPARQPQITGCRQNYQNIKYFNTITMYNAISIHNQNTSQKMSIHQNLSTTRTHQEMR